MIRPVRTALGAVVALVAPFAGCRHAPPVQAPVALHYTVAAPWRGERRVWFYPDARFAGRITGIAVPREVGPGQRARDGARLDPAVPAAAVQALQLPVVLRVTNLANGSSMLVRADDLGPADPGRVVALDAAASRALGVSGPTPVAVAIDPERSQAIADALGGIPRASGTAPQQAVSAVPLGPPGASSAATARTAGMTGATALSGSDGFAGATDPAAIPPITLTREPVGAVALMLDAGRFSDAAIARTIAARVGGRAVPTGVGGRSGWRVLAGPFATLPEADAALDRAIGSGLSGARITVATDSEPDASSGFDDGG